MLTSSPLDRFREIVLVVTKVEESRGGQGTKLFNGKRFSTKFNEWDFVT
jgi:hypothetical protein